MVSPPRRRGSSQAQRNRVDGMTTTNPSTGTPPGRKRLLPRWVGVVFPVALLGAEGIIALHVVNRVWLPVTLTIGGAAGLGLLAGFTARWAVPNRSRTTRWLVALGGLTVGLLAASLFSYGAFGVGPLFPLRQEVNWSDIAQLAIGALAAWLAVRGFSRPPALEGSEARPESAGAPTRTAWTLPDSRAVEETRPYRTRRRPAPLPLAGAASASAVHRGRISVGGPLRSRYHRLRDRLARAAAWRPRLGLLSRRRSDTPIRFTGPGEDRCPYCLDVVDPKDPRGVKLCPVCHTPHHADCWSITGMCQMPHLYGEGHATRSGVAR